MWSEPKFIGCLLHLGIVKSLSRMEWPKSEKVTTVTLSFFRILLALYSLTARMHIDKKAMQYFINSPGAS